jgi:chromosome partitioning protein
MLADVDFQQSIVSWLQRRRLRDLPGFIDGWVTDSKNVLRPPVGVAHSVMDTPGGIRGFELARLLVFADIVLMPVCDSAFDFESAAACLAEMRTHPRVASGRARVAVIGMRIAPHTSAEQRARAWAAQNDLEYIGSVRPAQVYVGCAASGMTLFDLAPATVTADLQLWKPILDWLTAALTGGRLIAQARRGRPGAHVPPVARNGFADSALDAAAPVTGGRALVPLALASLPAPAAEARARVPAGLVSRMLRMLPGMTPSHGRAAGST